MKRPVFHPWQVALRGLLGGLFFLGLPPFGAAEEPEPSGAALTAPFKSAIEKGLRRAEQGSANYTKNRQCFSCHHQAMPILSLTEAKRRGFEVEAAKIDKQVEFTLATFTPRIDQLVKGQGVGGATTTVGYAFMALHAAGHKPDETTTAMIRFILAKQRPDGSWAVSANRPPTEATSVTTTAVAVRGLKDYGPKEDDESKEATELRREVRLAIAKGQKWLLRVKPANTEEKVFRLFGLITTEADQEDIDEARQSLLKDQREDGGWSQLDTLESDAYATGTALVALRAAGLEVKDPAFQKGIKYLLKTQRDDGAWLVETRSKPIQTFFDNGDPGEKSQFISFVATNWATLALLEAVPVKPVGTGKD